MFTDCVWLIVLRSFSRQAEHQDRRPHCFDLPCGFLGCLLGPCGWHMGCAFAFTTGIQYAKAYSASLHYVLQSSVAVGPAVLISFFIPHMVCPLASVLRNAHHTSVTTGLCNMFCRAARRLRLLPWRLSALAGKAFCMGLNPWPLRRPAGQLPPCMLHTIVNLFPPRTWSSLKPVSYYRYRGLLSFSDIPPTLLLLEPRCCVPATKPETTVMVARSFLKQPHL